MKHILPALRSYLLFTLLLGLVYPLTMTGLGQVFFPTQANGSLVYDSSGHLVGSSLIAQKFVGSSYFWPRPSAIDFNPLPSGGSNLGPTSDSLVKIVQMRREQGLTHELLFASGSGLDPHISPEAAKDQISRVALSRSLPVEKVRAIVNQYIEKRDFGFLGEERVNVFLLNLALDREAKTN